jgi:hypothetical protein
MITLTKEQLAIIIEKQINKALTKFTEKHNKTHATLFLGFQLGEFGEGFTDPTSGSKVTAFGIDLRLTVNGASKLIYRKEMPVPTPEDKEDAQLTLYQDLLMHLMGMGILFNIVRELDEDTTRLQSSTTERRESKDEILAKGSEANS